MKNNFDLKGYMKENKVGSYQQLNEMWYQDINQALGDFNTMKEVEEREPEYNKEMEEGKFQDAIVPIKKTMDSLGYKGEYDPTILEGYIFTKDLGVGVMEITLTSLYDDKEKFTFTAAYFPKINQSQFFGLLKKQVIDYKNGKIVSDDVEHVDLGTGMFSLDEPGVENLIKSMVSKVESKANTKGAEEMEEGKKKLAFVIPCPDAYDIEEEAEHFQYLLDKAGVKAKVKANQVGEEAEVYTKDEKKARKVIEKNGYQIGWTEDNELEEMGGVKSIGDAGKMTTPNSRPNLGRHRSSDMLDKMSKKDHKTNTVVGAKAAAYKAPHMKEEESADDIFAGSDDANWKDNYGNETSEWDTEIAGQTINGWTAEETQGGAIAWQNPRYPNADIYATPGWEGVDGIALELHDSEDGYMDEPKIQKVVGAGTDLWKTKEGYMALMAKVFTTLEKMLTPSEEMAEDDGTGRQINHDFNDDISIDPSEFEDAIQEDEDPFSSIKGGIDKITMGDDDMDMSDDDRFDQLGGDKIKAGIESLMADGFDFREILQFVKDTIASKRDY